MNYPFGYQSSIKDNELCGDGNAYSTYFRELDVRLGRWFAIDPKTIETPWESPYVSMGNNPICYNDPDGSDVNSFKDKNSMKFENIGINNYAIQNPDKHSLIDRIRALKENIELKKLEQKSSGPWLPMWLKRLLNPDSKYCRPHKYHSPVRKRNPLDLWGGWSIGRFGRNKDKTLTIIHWQLGHPNQGPPVSWYRGSKAMAWQFQHNWPFRIAFFYFSPLN